MEKFAAAPPASLEARVEAVFTRRPRAIDVGKEPDEAEAARGIFERARVPPTAATPVGVLGLEGSLEYHRSAHPAALQNLTPEGRGDRAVLAQCGAHARALQELELPLRQPLGESSARPGAFGENLFLEGGDGFSSASICVGDVFGAWRGGRQLQLQLQASCPRRPCAKVDQEHGQTYSPQGIRAHAARTGRAAVMFRVLRPGDVQEGDVIRLVDRPNPAWPLARVGQLLYGDPEARWMGRADRNVLREEWQGTEAELRELAGIPELAVCEYREELVQMLGLPGIGRYRGQAGGSSALRFPFSARSALCGMPSSSPLVLTIGVVVLFGSALAVTARRRK